jgi:stage III sporulation protein AD
MVLFWKTLAAVFIALLIALTLEKQSKDMAVVLSTFVCCMVGAGVFIFLEPVFSFLHELQRDTYLEIGMLKTLLKLVGIGLLGEIVSVICADAGYNGLGKGVQLLASALILSLSVPVMTSLTELIRDILGGL